MTRRVWTLRASLCALWTLTTLLLISPPGAAATPELFEEATSGILELAGHSRLKIEGIRGTVYLRAGKTGELRYSGATRTARREAHPVALWVSGGTLIFRPAAGHEEQEIILEIAVSDGLRIEINKEGGMVQVASVLGDVSVHASQSEVDIRGVEGRVSVELEGGSLRLENLTQGAVVDGSDLETVVLTRIDGGLELNLSRSHVEASDIGSPFEFDLRATPMTVTSSQAVLVGSSTEGRLTLVDVRGGARLQLEDAPLSAERCRGVLEVETDAELTFSDLSGNLVVTGFAPVVRGDGHTGSVSVTTRDAEVALSNVAGAVTLDGDSLRIRLNGLGDTLIGKLVGSQLTADGVKGAVDLSNEFGDLELRNINGPTLISNRNGSVSVFDLTGTLEIDAEGPEVRVGWRSVGDQGGSRIVNRGGDLFVEFPAGAGGRISATAASVESNIEDLLIAADGRSANGLLARREKPELTLEASGRLVVSQASN